MSEDRKATSRAWVPIRVMVLAVALGGIWCVPNCAKAEDDELQKARGEAGRIWYEQYCRPCHGKGGAPGSAVFPDSKEPIDLRNYVQRHGGKFPAGQWLSVVFGPEPHRTCHDKVWKKIRREHQGPSPAGDAVARAIVASIAHYIISVQSK